jgi:23S rRNA (adenine2030-N6)-methyltransferase
MHYRHAYHAGSFADVVKHSLLTILLTAQSRKDKPWCYLETHSGAGDYALTETAATRTGEWREGIARVLADAGQAPAALSPYLDFAGAQMRRRRYPGSPLLALALARPGDRLVLCEQVPEVHVALRNALYRAAIGGTAVELHQRDGYQIHSLLPPRERRGLVLIDPPFENPREFDAVLALLRQCATRFAHGVYAAWYPLKATHGADRFRRRAQELGMPVLDARLWVGPPAAGRMRGCGVLILNPPFGVEDAAREALAWLTPRLAQHPKARFELDAGPWGQDKDA